MNKTEAPISFSEAKTMNISDIHKSIRKDLEWRPLVRLQCEDSAWKLVREKILLSDILWKDEYLRKRINYIYSSGYVFFDEWKKNVFLLTTDKNWKIQHQFTWGWPKGKEDTNFFILCENNTVQVSIEKFQNNAQNRLLERTNVTSIEPARHEPTFDWILKTSADDKSWDLLCLMHFQAGDFEGELSWKEGNKEKVVDWKWYEVNNSLDEIEWNSSKCICCSFCFDKMIIMKKILKIFLIWFTSLILLIPI